MGLLQIHARSLPVPHARLHTEGRATFAYQKPLKNQVLILPMLFKMEIILFPSLCLQGSLYDYL